MDQNKKAQHEMASWASVIASLCLATLLLTPPKYHRPILLFYSHSHSYYQLLTPPFSDILAKMENKKTVSNI